MMGTKRKRSVSAMYILATLLVFLPLVYCEQAGLLGSLSSDIVSGLVNDPLLSAAGLGGEGNPLLSAAGLGGEGNPLLSAAGLLGEGNPLLSAAGLLGEGNPLSAAGLLDEGNPLLSAAGFGGGGFVDTALKEVQSVAAPLIPLLRTTPGGAAVVDTFMKAQSSTKYASPPLKVAGGLVSPPFKVPLKVPYGTYGIPVYGSGKIWKTAVPVKKVTLKTVAGAKLLASKAAKTLKKVKILKKPKVHSLKPIVHVIEKPVPVFYKVPIPKKVLIPKFYPVFKPIPVPKIVPVPFKVPVKKIIPKIVKIPKAIPIPKFVPVKKLVPIGIPYPVPKIYRVPIPKPVPYPKFIPIPIPKKVPKFVPFPVKKIIKVPKPFYFPVKIPHFSASYVKTPTIVKVPAFSKQSFNLGVFPTPVKVQQQVNYVQAPTKVKVVQQPAVHVYEKEQQTVVDDVKVYEGKIVTDAKEIQQPVVNFIQTETEEIYKVKDADTEKKRKSQMEEFSLE